MKKIVKKLVATALALTMVLSMAACSMGDEKKESSDSGKKSDGEVKVGFVVSDMSDAFFAHLIKNIEKYAKEEGVTSQQKSVRRSAIRSQESRTLYSQDVTLLFVM